MEDAVMTGTVSLGIEAAKDIVLECVQHVGTEQAGIINAFGRTLAEDVTALTELPICDTAAVDGYAVMSQDTSGATRKNPRSLSVLTESVIGGKRLQQSTAVKVKKGDPLPEGADAVAASGDTYRPHNGPELLVLSEIEQRTNVNSAGSQMSKGQVVLSAGTLLGGAEMGLLASLGRHGVLVSRKPRISIITTGSGIVEIVDNLKAGEVRNKTRYELVGMVLGAGCELGRLIHVREGRLSLEKALEDSCVSDAIIIALGPNDKHDTAIQALRNQGFVHFERVHMEPGGATGFGTVEGKPIFILPANCATEAFEVIVRPGLLKLLGRLNVNRPKTQANFNSTLKLNPGRSHVIKSIATGNNGELTATPLSSPATDVKPWAIPNALVIIPENVEIVKRGEKVDVVLLEL